MAGLSTDFDTVEITADLVEVMVMGLPEEVADRPTFFFHDPRTHANADTAGRPWDFTSFPTGDDPPDPVQVPCTVEAREGESDETTIGTFDADEYILGFLPAQWALIEEFTYVTLGQRRFYRGKQLAPIGLYDITFRQIRVEATDV